MANNFLNYTGISYQDLITQINNKLNSDTRFSNFRESAIAQMMIEIFAGTTDLTNYYLERRAEESFFDTCRLKSSAISNSRQLGYVVTRPIPATTSLTMVLKGPFQEGIISAGRTLTLPKNSEFSYKGINYLSKETYTYTFTSSDEANSTIPSYLKEISFGLESSPDNFALYGTSDIPVTATDLVPIELFQGEQKTKEFLGVNNTTLGAKFQAFKIDDGTFCNLYGTEDFGYNHDSAIYNYPSNITRVGIGNTIESALPNDGSLDYRIDRRSLINYENLNDISVDSSSSKVCVMKTLPDETIELMFGDGNYSVIGPTTINDNVYVKYLSTLGSKANQIGVIGKKISKTTSVTVNGNDVSSNVSFVFHSNVVGGADMESIDSIKVNAPGIYYSLDRLTTRGDYASYLRSLTSPIDIRNAVAWGEQEEGEGKPIKKLFNVALFSAIGPLYNIIDSIHTSKQPNATIPNDDLSTGVLDDYYSPYIVTPSNYFNIMTKENVINQINEYILSPTSNITTVINKLNTRSQLSVKNIYLTPIIQDFDLKGNIYINKLTDIESTKVKINNAIYEYLDSYVDFDKAMYLSNIKEIIDSYPEVVYNDVYFEPTVVPALYKGFDPDTDGDIQDWSINGIQPGRESLSLIKEVYKNRLGWHMHNTVPYFNNLSQQEIKSSYIVFPNPVMYPYDPERELLNSDLKYDSGLTERWFYNILMKDIYLCLRLVITKGVTWKSFSTPAIGEIVIDVVDSTDLQNSFCESTYFNKIMARINNDFSYMIRYNCMLDSKKVKTDNILTYSLKNEVPKLNINTNYLYK
jgi:hypothetical protein